VRRNILWLVREMGKLPGLEELTLTTNGSQLDRMAGHLSDAGVKRINVSLDSLDEARFHTITRVGDLNKVLRGIEAARAAGFKKLKLNTVILKGRNEDEIVDLVDYVVARGMDISFIEEMPLGLVDEHDRALTFYSSDEVRRDIETRYRLTPTTETTGGPARYYRVADTNSRVGFISPHSHNFCESCNRVRVTVQGHLLLCLGQEHSVDLRHVMRANPGDASRLRQAIIDSMDIKPKGHDFDLSRQVVIMRHMSVTGG
jgi:cyclic pyranopterin phosphate synthase